MNPASDFIAIILLIGILFSLGILLALGAPSPRVKQFGRNLLGVGRYFAAIAFVLVVMVIVWFFPFIQQGWFMRNGEKSARRVVTGDELQAWALKVLAHPENQYLKTNYPAPLRKLNSGDLPLVMVSERYRNVCIAWGHQDWMAGFEIGPTNFVGDGHEWQPGVYWFFHH